MSLHNNVSSLNLIEAFDSSHPFLTSYSNGASTKDLIHKKLQNIEKIFEKIQKDLASSENTLEDFKQLFTIDEEGDLLLQVKSAVGLQLLGKEDLHDFMELASKIEKMLKEMHRDVKFFQKNNSSRQQKIESILANLKKIAQEAVESEKIFFTYKTTEEKLGPKFSKKILTFLQSARLSLLQKQPGIAPDKTPSLLKRIDDLEERLLTSEEKQSSTDFSSLIFTLPTVTLDNSQLKSVDGDAKGASATYFVLDASKKNPKKIGIFKPTAGDAGLKPAIPQGESMMRQIASYLIDVKNASKAHVALSVRAKFQEEIGALQVFKNSHGTLADLNSEDIKKLPAAGLQIAALHRARIYDLDAHLNNFLWKYEDGFSLISIDHDYSFPVFHSKEQLADINNALKIEISNFPQMNQPFENDVKKYILSWDVEGESAILYEMGLPIESIHLFKTVSWFLQAAAKEDLFPGEALDYLLSQNYSGKEKYPLVQAMIDLQDSLWEKYPDAYEEKNEAFEKEFAQGMQEFIQDKVRELKNDFENFGSYQRVEFQKKLASRAS
ncbi:MAG: hypothetical protein Tsb0015_13980 [Simkaniaceae bacterium]